MRRKNPFIPLRTDAHCTRVLSAFTGSRAAAQALHPARARPERVLQLSRVKSTRPNPFGDIGMAVSRSCVILLLMLSSASALCASAHSRSFASCDAFRVASDLPDAISTDTLLRQIGKSGGGVKVIGHSAEFSSLSRSSGEGGALAALLPRAAKRALKNSSDSTLFYYSYS